MPVSLLLQEVLGPLLNDQPPTLAFGTLALDRARRGLTRLGPFNRLVSLEETLIGRARSAFLVHWFGTGLPTEGLALRVSIANIDHLRRRYQAVLAATPSGGRGLNLTEPLLGLVGTVAGVVLSPAGIFSVTMLALRSMRTWLRILLGALAGVVVPAFGAVIGVLLLPAGLGVAVLAGLRNEQPLRALYDLMGALARLIHQVNQFIDLLLGPRERIRNPLLRQTLEVFDRFARLIPFVLALFSIVLARLGPLILPLARQGAALIPLTRAVLGAVGAILEEVPQVLGRAFSFSRSQPLGRLWAVFSSIGPMLQRVTERIKSLFEEVALTLPRIGERVMTAVQSFFNAARAVVLRNLQAHPRVIMLQTFRAQLADLGRLFAAPAATSAAPSSGGGSGSSGSTMPGWLSSALGFVFGPPPPLPSAPALPDLAAIEAMIGRPALSLDRAGIEAAASFIPAGTLDVFRLADRARADFDRAASPPSELARARRELARELGAPPAEVLARIRTEDLPLREALAAVMGRVLPPAIRAYLPDLLDLFRTLDTELYGVTPEQPAPPAFPVLHVPESRRLRVVVRRLQVRSAGSDGPHVGVFRDRLVEALQRQSYLAPATP
ncbi:hypothetical protein [Pyxidicoccus caerfyrddinensis]|uniref:hypothetical protein n=1 Tax=Pyxidicoccus caerfyrddinensis TaxID=2709663 RepID=UPI0013DB1743|nr:hypothetical protein [Pyxidicoccus caerfyrddinensis]